MSISHMAFERIIRSALITRPQEIGCGDAYRHLDRFAELWLTGENPSLEMPLVWDHLQRCDHCREEFEALIQVLD